jgi:DnaK suppressor protein
MVCMQHIPEETLADLETALLAERAALEEELSEHGKMSESGEWEASSTGLEGEETDPTDAADQIEELVTNVPLVTDLKIRYKDVKDAIKKLKIGTYGTCEECSEEIPLDRLEANAAARTCVQHAA